VVAEVTRVFHDGRLKIGLMMLKPRAKQSQGPGHYLGVWNRQMVEPNGRLPAAKEHWWLTSALGKTSGKEEALAGGFLLYPGGEREGALSRMSVMVGQ
jgi:hypothetical protein